MRMRDRIHISIILSFIASLSACTYAPKNTTVDNTYNARLMAIGGDSANEGVSSTTQEEEINPSSENNHPNAPDKEDNLDDFKFITASHLPKSARIVSPFLTLGSTKEDVVMIQGTPTRIDDYTYSGDVWHYGYSSIRFDMNDKIKEWNNSGNLKVRMQIP
jgi:hypothetical protein